MLIIVCGLQGTGKTVVATKIAEKTDAVLLRTDVIRKELFPHPTYGKEEIESIYDEMFGRAKKLLVDERTVILDATFAEKHNRHRAKKIADEAGSQFKMVEVICPDEEIIRERLKKRTEDESDAQYEQYLNYKKIFEPITGKHIIIDNTGTLEETEKQINNLFTA
jgi:predicted kinase